MLAHLQGESVNHSKLATNLEVGATHRYIVYGGDDEFPVGGGVAVVSFSRLLAKIRGVWNSPSLTGTSNTTLQTLRHAHRAECE